MKRIALTLTLAIVAGLTLSANAVTPVKKQNKPVTEVKVKGQVSEQASGVNNKNTQKENVKTEEPSKGKITKEGKTVKGEKKQAVTKPVSK